MTTSKLAMGAVPSPSYLISCGWELWLGIVVRVLIGLYLKCTRSRFCNANRFSIGNQTVMIGAVIWSGLIYSFGHTHSGSLCPKDYGCLVLNQSQQTFVLLLKFFCTADFISCRNVFQFWITLTACYLNHVVGFFFFFSVFRKCPSLEHVVWHLYPYVIWTCVDI